MTELEEKELIKREELIAFQDITLSEFSDIKKQINEGLRYPKASSETIAMYGDLKDEIKELKHILFGNKGTDEKGIKEKVDEMHTILTQVKGIKSLFLLIILGSSTYAAIRYFFKPD